MAFVEMIVSNIGIKYVSQMCFTGPCIYDFHDSYDNPTGFRGQVEVNGETFLGSLVCKSKAQAHQEVAKKALQELATAIAKEEAALGQAVQSQTVLQAGNHSLCSSVCFCRQDTIRVISSLYEKECD